MIYPNDLEGAYPSYGDQGPQNQNTQRASERSKHLLSIIEKLEKMSFFDRIFHYKKYSKLRDQLKNHKKYFPEYYL